jgi:hypothetical protein
MVRYMACLAAALLAGAAVRAGELDAEFGAKATVAKASSFSGSGAALSTLALNVKVEGARASELDDESPAQSWRCFRGWGCRGWGCGWRGWGCGWRGWCGWRPWGCGFGWPCYGYCPPVVSIGFGYPGWGGYW